MKIQDFRNRMLYVTGIGFILGTVSFALEGTMAGDVMAISAGIFIVFYFLYFLFVFSRINWNHED